MTLADVSRETMDKLNHFVALIEKWNPKINLVSRGSLNAIWDRHIEDSAQVFAFAPKGGHWVDMGSGGGLPGIVCAILADELDAFDRFTLIESDLRKAVFLRTAIRECELNATVRNDRVEDLEPLNADLLSARALASLDRLLELGLPHLKRDGTALFPKGATWQKELADARQTWKFESEAITSKTEPQAVILKLRGLERA
ncbi:16S rRNA (guanine(527)-N(7))-methyltransferase RsmG [Cribrihabitans sp. XS_ASV171]